MAGRKKINVDKQEQELDLTPDSENTTMSSVKNELIRQAESVRGRRARRKAIESGVADRKSRRKYIGQHAKMDVSHFYELYPELFNGMVLRWVNDENGEIQRMEMFDWIPVKLDGDHQFNARMFSDERENVGASNGSVVRIPVGRGRTTDSMYAVLMMKDKEFFEEDEVQYQKDQYEAQTLALKQGVNQTGQNDDRAGNPPKRMRPMLRVIKLVCPLSDN